MEFPKWWWKLPLSLRYWLHVIWAWVCLVFNFVILAPLSAVLSMIVWLKNDLPDMIAATWEDHWETLRIYKLLRDKQLAKKNPDDKITLTREEITGKEDDDHLAH